MADVIRTETRVQRRTTRRGEITDTATTIGIRTTVRSIRGRTDASVIRDFARALDAADAPGMARIEAHRDDVGHLIELVAAWDEPVVPPDPPDS